MKKVKMNPKRRATLEDAKIRILGLIAKDVDSGRLTIEDFLALMAFCTGACIAMQDHRKMSREAAMDIVIKNIEIGNQEVIKEVMGPKGSA